MKQLNWFGLVGGASIIVLILVSLFVPWWQFQIGQATSTGGKPLLVVDVSPLNTNFGGLGNSFTIPLIWALNLASILTMLASGILMVIYSVLPTKPYAMKLLSFSYRKPLYAVVFFAASLFALSAVVNSLLGVNIPIMGSANVQFPQNLTQGASVSMQVSANFLWPFWFSVAVAAFSLATRLYHRKIVAVTSPLGAPSQILVKTPSFPLQGIQKENETT